MAGPRWQNWDLTLGCLLPRLRLFPLSHTACAYVHGRTDEVSTALGPGGFHHQCVLTCSPRFLIRTTCCGPAMCCICWAFCVPS